MKILSIDTSSKICGVTISENEKILIHLHNDDERTHSVKLMPMIDKALKNTKLTLDDIALFAVCIGPGSFTGVRIGIATIKAFADVKKIPVVGVSSLESLAYNILDNINIENTVVCSLIDAKNSNVYCGIYKFCKSDATLKCGGLDIFAEDIDTTINKIQKFSKYNIMFVGDGATNYLEKIKQNFPEAKFANFESSGFSASADIDLNLQNSNSIARAALSKYMQGQIGDSTSISPIYLKKSQAERALEEKIQKENDEKAKYETEDEVIKAVCDEAKVDIPNGMIELELDNMVKDIETRLSYQGMNMEQYLQMMNKTMDDFRNENKEQAEKTIKTRLVLEAVGKEANVEVTEEEISKKIKEMAENYGRKEEEVKDNPELVKYVGDNLKVEKTIDFLVENAKIK